MDLIHIRRIRKERNLCSKLSLQRNQNSGLSKRRRLRRLAEGWERAFLPIAGRNSNDRSGPALGRIAGIWAAPGVIFHHRCLRSLSRRPALPHTFSKRAEPALNPYCGHELASKVENGA